MSRGWAGEVRCFADPVGGAVCKGLVQYPLFAFNTLFLLRALQRWQLGFWSFHILLSIDLPQLASMQLFLVPYSFFVFCCWRRRVSRYKQCCKGSWVPACLTSKAASFSCGCCSVSLGQVPAQSPPWARWLPNTALCACCQPCPCI